MNLKVRKAITSDIKIIEQFQDNLVNFERILDKRIKNGKVSYYNIKNLVKSRNAHFVVCESGKKIIGCGFGEIRKEPEWSTDREFGYVGLMFVDEKFRSAGAGKIIISEIILWLQSKNIKEIRLKVYDKNENAVAFYKKSGFKNFVIEMRLE